MGLITLSDTHTYSVGLFCTRNRLFAEPSTWKHTTLTRDRHPCLRRDWKPQSRRASERARGRKPMP